jgi:hypothetical protein
MSNAVQLAVAGFLSGKNRIINGDARVTQRTGISMTTGNTGFGAADRWKVSNQAGSGTVYCSQTSAYNDINGIPKLWVFQRCDAVFSGALTGSQYVGGIYQIIEGYSATDLLGKQVTVSFQFRANITGVFAVALRDNASAYSCVKNFTYSTSNTAQYVTLTFPAIPTAATIPFSTATGLVLNIGALSGPTYIAPSTDSWVVGNYQSSSSATNWMAATTNQINVTEVQLEAGPMATPFERRPYGLELMLCQRYYIAGAHNFRGYELAGTNVIQTLSLPVSMRASPTLAWTTNPTVSSNVGIPTLGVLNVFQISFTGAVSTTGDCYWINGIWAANAEL